LHNSNPCRSASSLLSKLRPSILLTSMIDLRGVGSQTMPTDALPFPYSEFAHALM
jgi:hypothetical protein